MVIAPGRFAKIFAASIAFGCVGAGPSHAWQVIEAACKITGGPGASLQFCTCMQQVADLSLSLTEQKLAAFFLRNPGEAGEIKRRNPAHHQTFWTRFESFSLSTRRHCVGWRDAP
jgi:hypothetical protein